MMTKYLRPLSLHVRGSFRRNGFRLLGAWKCPGTISRHRLQVAQGSPADDIAPHVPDSPPSAGGVQELHLLFKVEGGDLGGRNGGAIPEGQAGGVHKVPGRRWCWGRHFRGRRGFWG